MLLVIEVLEVNWSLFGLLIDLVNVDVAVAVQLIVAAVVVAEDGVLFAVLGSFF